MKKIWNKFSDAIRKNLALTIIMILFFCIYASISFVNHFNFRTYAWDLGIYNNAIYDHAHFRFNDCMLMQPQYKNLLSNHFSLTPMLFSPFYFLFGTYTLLVFQILSFLFGGIGIYLLINEHSGNKKYGILSALYFYSVWGIFSALSFDYHNNVVGTMFVPWFFYFVYKEKWSFATLFLFLVLTSKENMAIWMIFIIIGLLIFYRKEKQKKIPLAVFSAVSLTYFIVVVSFIMPAISNAGRSYQHFNYDALGANVWEAIVTVFSQPRYTFNLLFENQLNKPFYNGIKTELYFILLLSGGWTLFYKPEFLIMLLPVFAQKMFNGDINKWGINGQYSIEFVPIVTYAVFYWILKINFKYKFVLAITVVALCLGTTISTIDYRVSKFYTPAYLRFWYKKHYVRKFEVKPVYKVLDKIPENVPVSAQSMIVPHLAFRDYIYQFPDVYDSEYIILLPADENSFPFSKSALLKKIEEYKKSEFWNVFYESETCIVFKRK